MRNGRRRSGPSIVGQTLKERLAKGRISHSEGIRILHDVAQSIALLHDDGAVDGALAPSRISLSFGDAVISGSAHAALPDDEAGRYLAPEQIHTGPSVSGDIYAWGVMAYEVITGLNPFVRATPEAIARAQQNEQPVHLLLSNPDVPNGVSAVIMRALAKDPAQRPASARVIVQALDTAPVKDLPLSQALDERRRDWWHTPAKLLAAVAIIAFAFKDTAYVDRILGFVEPVVPDSLFAGGANEIKSVAVLPFKLEGRGAAPAYLGSAVAGEIAHALARVSGIRIGGMASARAYRGPEANSFLAGKALNVDAVVSGAILQTQNGIRVRVRLGTAQTGVALLRDSVEGPLADMGRLVDEVSRAISAALVSRQDRSVVAGLLANARGTANPQAYQTFLQAAYDSGSRTTAPALYQRAVSLDPRFARASAMVARAALFATLAAHGNIDSAAAELTTMAARAALSDSTSPEAQIVLADVMVSTRKFGDAYLFYMRALRRIPGDADTHVLYAKNLYATGRISAALPEARQVALLDPFGEQANVLYAETLIASRSYADAAEQMRAYLNRDSTSAPAKITLGRALVFSGSAGDAIPILENAFRRDSSARDLRVSLLIAYASARRNADVARLSAQILRSAPTPDFDHLVTSIAAGDNEGALATLEAAVRKTSDLSNGSHSIGCDPVFDLLKSESRYLVVLNELGVTSCTVADPWTPSVSARRPPPASSP